MNIQDIISTIINYIKNMNKKDLIIFSLVFYTLYKTKTIEKNTDLNETNIREQIKSVYQADVQAIKNLGDLASKMINVEGNTLTLPYNVKIEGSLVSTNTIEAASWIGGKEGVYSGNKNIYLTWVTAGPKLTVDIDIDADDNKIHNFTIPGNVKIKGSLESTGDTELHTNAPHKGYHLSETGLWLRNKKLNQVTDIIASGEIKAKNFTGNGFFVKEGVIFGSKFKSDPTIYKESGGIKINGNFFATNLRRFIY